MLSWLRTSRIKVNATRMESPWTYICILVPVCMLSYLFFKRKKHKTDTSIVVFTRYPVPGTTKTRLIPALGKEGAAYLQLLMSNHIVRKLKALCTKQRNIGLDIWYNGGIYNDMLYWMKERNVCDVHLVLHEQPKGGLGHKLQTAAMQSLSEGKEYVLIIGSDIPGIDEKVITAALEKLKSGADMVLGPAADGGYYLVGFSKHAQKYLDSVFDDIDWGTERVFKQQSEKANQVGAKLDVLPFILNDVDLEEDIPVVEKELGISRSHLTEWRWSVIIPTLNEENTIRETLDMVVKKCSDIQCLQEIIICDGGSQDRTVQKIEDFSKQTSTDVKVINCRAGRGYQLREGTAVASGDHLLFIHSDSLLPDNYDVAAKKCLLIPGNVAGAYKLGFDVLENPVDTVDASFRWRLNFICFLANDRFNRYELPYGDNGIFMSKKTYELIGGFEEVYLLEDVILIEKLWRQGHVAMADCGPMVTSSRRWQKYGAFRVTALNKVVMWAYSVGVKPNTLAAWYYGKDKIKQ